MTQSGLKRKSYSVLDEVFCSSSLQKCIHICVQISVSIGIHSPNGSCALCRDRPCHLMWKCVIQHVMQLGRGWEVVAPSDLLYSSPSSVLTNLNTFETCLIGFSPLVGTSAFLSMFHAELRRWWRLGYVIKGFSPKTQRQVEEWPAGEPQ